jgi:hypothetical protein
LASERFAAMSLAEQLAHLASRPEIERNGAFLMVYGAINSADAEPGSDPLIMASERDLLGFVALSIGWSAMGALMNEAAVVFHGARHGAFASLEDHRSLSTSFADDWKSVLARSALGLQRDRSQLVPTDIRPLADAITRHLLIGAKAMAAETLVLEEQDRANGKFPDMDARMAVRGLKVLMLAEEAFAALSLEDRRIALLRAASYLTDQSAYVWKQHLEDGTLSGGDFWYFSGIGLSRLSRLAYALEVPAAAECHDREAGAMFKASTEGSLATQVNCRAEVYQWAQYDEEAMTKSVKRLEPIIQHWTASTITFATDSAKVPGPAKTQ